MEWGFRSPNNICHPVYKIITLKCAYGTRDFILSVNKLLFFMNNLITEFGSKLNTLCFLVFLIEKKKTNVNLVFILQIL